MEQARLHECLYRLYGMYRAVLAALMVAGQGNLEGPRGALFPALPQPRPHQAFSWGEFVCPLPGNAWQECPQPRGVFRELDYFLSSTALRDCPKGPPTANHQPPPTANRCQAPIAANHQPPPTANGHQLPTSNPANRHQPPITNHQLPPCTTNRHYPPATTCQPPTATNHG